MDKPVRSSAYVQVSAVPDDNKDENLQHKGVNEASGVTTPMSYDIELSFLPTSRARPAPSATQLSSARDRRPARRHVHAAWESAEVVTQAPWPANFAVTSDRSEASKTGKPDSLWGED
jgi:hypothetical protein